MKNFIEDTKVSQGSNDRDSSLIINKNINEDCNCGVIARALGSNVHLNINLPKQRFKE